MFQKLFISTAIAVVFASAAQAADQVYMDPAVSPVTDTNYDWSGVYVGAHIGYATGNASTTGLDGGAFDSGSGEGYATTVDPNGAFGGLQAGYNWQRGRFVAGVAADLGYLGASDEQFGYPDAPGTLTDTGMVVDYGWYGAITGRVGYAANRTLIYAKGGVVFADVDVAAGDLDGAQESEDDFDVSDTTDTGGTETGYTIGAGVEYALNNGWSVNAEYQYMDFGSFTSTDPSDNRYETDLDLHTIKVGVNYKF